MKKILLACTLLLVIGCHTAPKPVVGFFVGAKDGWSRTNLPIPFRCITVGVGWTTAGFFAGMANGIRDDADFLFTQDFNYDDILDPFHYRKKEKPLHIQYKEAVIDNELKKL